MYRDYEKFKRSFNYLQKQTKKYVPLEVALEVVSHIRRVWFVWLSLLLFRSD